MPAAPHATTPLSIEIVQDLVCPWCYLGFRRLVRTLERRPALAVEFRWRAFLLNPDMPRAGLPVAEYAVRKFGGEDRARRLHASIAELGLREGLVFRFDRIRRVPSSINAHRLVRFAARRGDAAPVVGAIYRAFFHDGQDVGDVGVLAALAGLCGISPVLAREALRDEEDAEAVHAESLRAHRIGINGVPCFMVDGRHAIAGAQEPEVIERLLDVAAAEATEPGDG